MRVIADHCANTTDNMLAKQGIDQLRAVIC
jgi:hypothetical protein